MKQSPVSGARGYCSFQPYLIQTWLLTYFVIRSSKFWEIIIHISHVDCDWNSAKFCIFRHCLLGHHCKVDYCKHLK